MGLASALYLVQACGTGPHLPSSQRECCDPPGTPCRTPLTHRAGLQKGFPKDCHAIVIVTTSRSDFCSRLAPERGRCISFSSSGSQGGRREGWEEGRQMPPSEEWAAHAERPGWPKSHREGRAPCSGCCAQVDSGPAWPAASRVLNSELPAGDKATGPVPQRVGCGCQRSLRCPPLPWAAPEDGEALPRPHSECQTLGTAGNRQPTSVAVGRQDLCVGGRLGGDRPIGDMVSAGGEPDVSVSRREGRRATGCDGRKGREGTAGTEAAKLRKLNPVTVR